MDLDFYKLLMAVALFVMTIVIGYFPYFHFLSCPVSTVGLRYRNRMIALLNCFAGGVFLGALMIHILIKGAVEFESYKEVVGLEMDFPFFYTLVAMGFFLVAVVEIIAQSHIMPKQYGDISGALREEESLQLKVFMRVILCISRLHLNTMELQRRTRLQYLVQIPTSTRTLQRNLRWKTVSKLARMIGSN